MSLLRKVDYQFRGLSRGPLDVFENLKKERWVYTGKMKGKDESNILSRIAPHLILPAEVLDEGVLVRN